MFANYRHTKIDSQSFSITSEYSKQKIQSVLGAAGQTRKSLHSTTPLAPDFQLTSTDGQSVRLSDFRGVRVILAFSATWGRLCQSQLPALTRLDRKDGVRVLAICSGEAPNIVEDFVSEHNIPFPVLSDCDGKVKQQYQVTCLPMTFCIDEQGRIAGMYRGEVDEATLNHWLAGVSSVAALQ
jgi:peroxiredoxin